jgi:large subunit ribosomal protein L18
MRKPLGKVKSESSKKRLRRKLSIRKKISGSAECPRISVTKSDLNFYVQAIDDVVGNTLCGISTYGKTGFDAKPNKEGAKKIGEEIGKRLIAKKIQKAVFDRNGHKFSLVMKSLADGIRSTGIQV